MSARYDPPPRAAAAVNTLIRGLAEAGVSLAGTSALRVRGRTTGRWRSVVVNPLTVDGTRYLVAPRGNTQWVRNLRAAGAVELGPRWRRRPFGVADVADDAKPAVLRRYLARWYWQVKGYTGGVTPDSTDDELLAAAPSIPVFALRPARR